MREIVLFLELISCLAVFSASHAVNVALTGRSEVRPSREQGILKRQPRMATIQPSELAFRLYTKDDRETGVLMSEDSKKSMMTPAFDAKLPTKIIIHGFLNDAKTEYILEMRNNYLARSAHNIITLDWSTRTQMFRRSYGPEPRLAAGSSNDTRRSSSVGRPKARSYESAVVDAIPVGILVAKFIDNLVDEFGVSLELLHLIGHSLGAQVCGVAGSHVKSGKVGRITGLDPAAPKFDTMTEDKRLDESDAVFVDVIHTDTIYNGGPFFLPNHYGYRKPCGHADFYPNGGDSMPECKDGPFHCSHSSAHAYFVKSIKEPQLYPGYKCSSLDEEIVATKAQTNQDSCTKCCDACPEPGVYMGDAATPTKPGLYYVYTLEAHKPRCGAAGRSYRSAERGGDTRDAVTKAAASRPTHSDTVYKVSLLSCVVRFPRVVPLALFGLVFVI